MKKVIADVGRLADERPPGHLDGYLAERPSTEGLKDCIRVWAPCGCCWTYMSPNASVLTQCDSEEHNFDWKEAEAALNALRAAEEGEKSGGKSELAIVKTEDNGKEG